MKKFMVIYHAPIDAMKQTAESSPEEMEKGMQEWMKWAQKCGDKLLDMGTPLMGGIKLKSVGNIESSEKNVCGYSFLQAENIEEAKALLAGHPHLGWNEACEIEIHESMPLPGM